MPEQLHKSRTNKVFAGVCGGLAEYFNVDATLIRLVWALAVFIGGSGLILYILGMIIMPDDPRIEKTKAPIKAEGEESEAENNDGSVLLPAEKQEEREDKRHQILGLILLSLGAYFLLERFFPFFNLHNWWPMILIVIGLAILLKSKGGKSR